MDINSNLNLLLNRTIQSSHEILAFLETSKLNVEVMIDQHPDALLICQGNCNILKGNLSAAALLNIHVEDLLGISIEILFGADGLSELVGLFSKLYSGKEEIEWESQFNYEGEVKYFIWTVKLLHRRTDEASSVFLLSGKDLTAIRKYEKQLEMTLGATRAMTAATTKREIALCAVHFLQMQISSLKSCAAVLIDLEHAIEIRLFGDFKERFLSEPELLKWRSSGEEFRLGPHGMFAISAQVNGNIVALLVFEGQLNCLPSDSDRIFLDILSLSFGICIENLNQSLTKIASARMEGQLAAIETIQTSFLPTFYESDSISIYYTFKSAEHAGGDWLGYVLGEDGKSLLGVIADVTGHGVPAAMMTGVICGGLYSAISAVRWAEKQGSAFKNDQILVQIAESLHSVVKRTGNGRLLATALFVILDLESGKLDVLNAGHPHPFMWVANQEIIKPILCRGNRLGGLSSDYTETTSVQLNPGDFIFMYTDGLFENTDIGGVKISLKEISKRLGENMKVGGLKQVFDAVVNMERNLGANKNQEDDMATMLIHWRGKSALHHQG